MAHCCQYHVECKGNTIRWITFRGASRTHCFAIFEISLWCRLTEVVLFACVSPWQLGWVVVMGGLHSGLWWWSATKVSNLYQSHAKVQRSTMRRSWSWNRELQFSELCRFVPVVHCSYWYRLLCAECSIHCHTFRVVWNERERLLPASHCTVLIIC